MKSCLETAWKSFHIKSFFQKYTWNDLSSTDLFGKGLLFKTRFKCLQVIAIPIYPTRIYEMLALCQVHLGVLGRKQRFLPFSGDETGDKGQVQQIQRLRSNSLLEAVEERNRAQDTRDGQLSCPRPEEDSILLRVVRDTEDDTGAKSWRRGRPAERVCRRRGNSQSRSPEAGRCLARLRSSWGGHRRGGGARRTVPERDAGQGRTRRGSGATRGPASSSQWQTHANRAPTSPDPWPLKQWDADGPGPSSYCVVICYLATEKEEWAIRGFGAEELGDLTCGLETLLWWLPEE